MKKIFALFILSIGMFSCNTGADSSEAIKKEINENKSKIVDLEAENQRLEKILADSGLSLNSGRILVGVQSISPESFTHYLDINGSVESELNAMVSPEINGMIKSINVVEGQYVKKGDLLANIDTDITLKSIEEVKTQLELAKTIYKKQKELWNQKIGSEIQYLQAKSNKEAMENKLETLNAQIKMAALTAPFDGYVETVFQKVGEIGSPGRQLVHLVNLNKLKVIADISESYIPYIKVGDSVEISFPTFPQIKLKEPISVIGSVINANNRTVKIQLQIHNNQKLLKSNILANIKLVDDFKDSAIVIPSIVVKNDANGRNYIYMVADREDVLIAQKKYIKIGKSYGNKTVVTEGLSLGEKLIIQGYNLVKNGSVISIK